MSSRIKEKRQLIYGSFVLLFLAGILFVRSFYSFSWSDESLYMAEVHRLFLGEKPFVDEWHPTQFYSILLLPLYRLYVGTRGTTEGIYLWARFFNLMLAFLAAEISYISLNKYFMLENWLSIVGGAMVILYNMGNVGGVSYHNFFFYCYTMAIMLSYIGISCYRTKKAWYKYVAVSCISGLFCGAAIITVPTCAFCMGIVYVALLVWAVKTRTIKNFVPIWFQIIFVILVGMIYIFVVFSKVSITDLWKTFPFLFMDESHHQREFIDVIGDIGLILSVYGKRIIIAVILLRIIRLICVSCKKVIGEQGRAVAYVLIVLICMRSLYLLSDSHMSAYVIFSLAGIGLFCLEGSVKIFEDFIKSDVNLFLIVPALVTVFTFLMASATIAPTYQGGVYIALASLLAFSRFKQTFRMHECRIIVNGITAVCLIVMLGMLLNIRVFTVYRDAPLNMIDTVITRGPAKGLQTTREHVEQYNDCMEIMDYVSSSENYEEDCMLISVLAPWMYVSTDVHNGGISPWQVYLDEPLMEKYYEYHNIKNLKYIVVLNKDIGGYIAGGTPEGADYTPNANKNEGFIYDYIRENSYAKIEYKCGVLYVRERAD